MFQLLPLTIPPTRRKHVLLVGSSVLKMHRRGTIGAVLAPLDCRKAKAWHWTFVTHCTIPLIYSLMVQFTLQPLERTQQMDRPLTKLYRVQLNTCIDETIWREPQALSLHLIISFHPPSLICRQNLYFTQLLCTMSCSLAEGSSNRTFSVGGWGNHIQGV